MKLDCHSPSRLVPETMPTSIRRRNLLLGFVVTAIGCKKLGTAPEPPVDDDLESSSIPLRILVVGDSVDGQTIARGWQSIGGGDLDISTIQLMADSSELIDAVGQCDVVLSPAIVTADLVNANAIDPPRGEFAETLAQVWLPSIRAALIRYGDRDVAFPIGTPMPVIVSNGELPEIKSWNDFDQLVIRDGQKFAMPTAAGQAAWTFLTRLPSIGPAGLFHREDFTPLIDSAENVAALTTLVTMIGRCQPPPTTGWTATAIWSAVAEGELTIGLGSPGKTDSATTELVVTAPPVDGNRRLVDPMSPVAMVSSRCRQSQLANQFVQFISGDATGTETRQTISSATPVRISDLGVNAYQQIWARELGSPLIVPTLRILSGWQYYRALDDAIIKCFGGEVDPSSALRSVAEQWDALTQRIGRNDQLRSMRRNQGFRA